jgi:hypothetical protein
MEGKKKGWKGKGGRVEGKKVTIGYVMYESLL